MAEVVFFEKPGCINNTRQKSWLRASGHTVIERNLLTEPWRAEDLRAFFGKRPVHEWFNRSAPAITRGGLIPESLDEQEALALMLLDPLLIRRPLMQAHGERRVGFEPESVRAWIGLNEGEDADLERCPRPADSRCAEGEMS